MISILFTFHPFERIMFKIYSKIFLYDSFGKVNKNPVPNYRSRPCGTEQFINSVINGDNSRQLVSSNCDRN